MAERYPIEQSGLYRLTSVGRLAAILGVTRDLLREIRGAPDSYRVWNQAQANGKTRTIEAPRGQMKLLHERLAQILSRTVLPDYLHSGRKGHSYLSNAGAHRDSECLIGLDISKFYHSTTRSALYHGFLREFKCGPTVAALIADVFTYEGHVPTGSSASMLLAYFAHKDRFDRVARMASARNLIFTLYVDDITISGDHVSVREKLDIDRIFEGTGLRLHKYKRYTAQQPKAVTGSILKNGKTYLPNRRHLRIHMNMEKLREALPAHERSDLIRKIRGQLVEAANVEPDLGEKRDSFQRFARRMNRTE